MLRKMIKGIEGLNPWHFLWIGIILSELFTFVMNSLLSTLWWGHISRDLLLIGTIDAFVVAFIVVTLGIYFINSIRETRIINEQLNQEIKERKQAEESFRESEAKYRALVETTDTGFVIVDVMGTVLDANQRYVELSGHDRFKEIQGKSHLEWTAPHHRERNIQGVQQCFQDGFLRNFEIDYIRKNGGLTSIEINASVVRTDSVVRVMALCRDITKRKASQEMMIQTEKMMSVGGLAAGMAHEINNPLAGMIQNAQVITNRLTKDLPANTKAAQELGTSVSVIKAYMHKRGILQQLESIHKAGRHAARIVDNMLSFAKKSRTPKKKENLGELIDRAIELAGNDYNLKKKYDFRNILIFRDYAPDIPAVLCDESKIQQVLFNIIKNASEAMHRHNTSPTLHFRLSKISDRVCVEIEDNGPGIDPEDQKRIFEPFFTTKSVDKGTGLGLSVSYFIIVDDHKGEMGVESQPGSGTRFIIKLPIADQAPDSEIQ